MKDFNPASSFGYAVSRRYDEHLRGDEAETVAFLSRMADGRGALEFAIGTGRVALPLSRTGVRVDGIELSLDMVDRMREKPDGSDLQVIIGDMSRATTGRTYGLVYLVYNTIGNLLTQDDQVQCFKNAARTSLTTASSCSNVGSPPRPHDLVISSSTSRRSNWNTSLLECPSMTRCHRFSTVTM